MLSQAVTKKFLTNVLLQLNNANKHKVNLNNKTDFTTIKINTKTLNKRKSFRKNKPLCIMHHTLFCVINLNNGQEINNKCRGYSKCFVITERK